jgi:imidazolonepropionase-like amidohydrolase
VPRGRTARHRIDATGLFVMPGIIDAHSRIAVDAPSKSSLSVTSMVGVGVLKGSTSIVGWPAA